MKTETRSAKDLGLLANNGIDVQSLQTCLSQSDTLGNTVPGIIKRLAQDGGWQEFVFPSAPGTIHRWSAADFRRFIEAPRPAGCQTPIHVLARLLKDTDAWVTFQELTRGEPGGANNPHGLGGKSGKTADEIDNCDSVTVVNSPVEPSKPPPTGNSVSYALRRLSRERPDLYERVKAREISPNAAMIEAGFRDAQITIPLDPRKAGRRIARHLTHAQFSELVSEALSIYTGKERAE